MLTPPWQRGQLVVFGDRLAVVIATGSDSWVPEDHLALWFGEAQGRSGNLRHEVWTVPAEYCTPAEEPVVRH